IRIESNCHEETVKEFEKKTPGHSISQALESINCENFCQLRILVVP
ncbi:4062_t:CDS:1, partial [Scutellospora calospora]